MVGNRKGVGEFGEDPHTGDTWAAGEVDDSLVASRWHAKVNVLTFGENSRILSEGVDDFVVRAGSRDDEVTQ